MRRKVACEAGGDKALIYTGAGLLLVPIGMADALKAQGLPVLNGTTFCSVNERETRFKVFAKPSKAKPDLTLSAEECASYINKMKDERMTKGVRKALEGKKGYKVC